MAGVRFAQVKAPNFPVALTDWLQLLVVLRIKRDEELTRNDKRRELQTSNMSVPRVSILSGRLVGEPGFFEVS